MEMELAHVLTSLILGLGLSAACGFRIFVPLTIINLAAKAEYLDLASGFEWVGSTPATLVFVSATLLEIGAYYIPVVDNLLDTVAAPAAVVAGTLVTATQIGEMDPIMTWTLSAVVGGGAAGVVQGLTTAARSVTTLATGGFGNPFVSTFEAGASVAVPIMMLVAAVPTVLGILVVMFWLAKKIFERRQARVEATAQTEAAA